MTEYRYSNCRCCKPTIITDCCPEGLARQLTLNYESTCECIGTGSVTMTYVLTPIDPTIIAVTGWTGAGWEVDIDFSDCDNNNGSHLYMYFYCENGVRVLGGVFYAYDETEVLESAGIIGTEDACFSWGHSGGNPSITAPPMWNGTSYVCDDSSPGHQMAFTIEGPGVSKCCPDECCPFGLGEVLTLAYNTTCVCIGLTGTINLIYTTAASCPVVTQSAPQPVGWEGTLDLADCDNNNGAKIYFFYYCTDDTYGERRLYIAMQAETEAAGTNVVGSINIEDDCFSYGHDIEGNPAITLINIWNGTGYVCPEAPFMSVEISGPGIEECCQTEVCVAYEIVGGPGSGIFETTLEGSSEDTWSMDYDYEAETPSWSFYILCNGVRVHGPIVVTGFIDLYHINSVSDGPCSVCSCDNVPDTLWIMTSSVTGGAVIIVRDGDSWSGSAFIEPCSVSATFTFSCNPECGEDCNGWELSIDLPGLTPMCALGDPACSCDPFSISFNGTLGDPCDLGFPMTISAEVVIPF